MTTNIILIIIVTSVATYISRFFGVVTSEKIKENSKIFKWFNCLAYSTLAALISRIIIFPNGDLDTVSLNLRIFVIFMSLIVFFIFKRNLVYPTLLSAILLSFISSI